MYSISSRFNKILFFGLFNLVALCLLNYFIGVFLLKGRNVQVSFEMLNDHKETEFYQLNNVKYRAYWDSYQGVFNAEFKNMNTLENWNTKQLYVYIELVWEGANGKR